MPQTAATDINHYLRSLSGQTVYYMPNPGNVGDSMLAYITFKLFRNNGIDYRIITEKNEAPEGEVLIYGAGGSLSTAYNSAREFVMHFSKIAKKLIILPQSYNTNEDMLRGFGPEVDIFCRELVSLEFLKRHAPNANVFLTDDLALQIDAREVLSMPRPNHLMSFFHRALLKAYDLSAGKRSHKNFPMSSRLLRCALLDLKKGVSKLLVPSSSQVINCFREDMDCSNSLNPPDNLDLSSKFMLGVMNESVAAYATATVFWFLKDYDLVRTNRLHLCIAAALLGKNVEFYPNNFFKCKAIYNYSLKNRFQNVRWKDSR